MSPDASDHDAAHHDDGDGSELDADLVVTAEELAASLLATEAWLEERGWGLNPLVLALQIDDPDEDEGEGEGDEVEGTDVPDDDDWDDEDDQDEGDDLVYGVIGEGDPLAILDGLDASDQVALVVALEQGGVRTVTALTSDGTALSVSRRRGENPVAHGEADETLVAALQAALHPPTD